ncbi:MAG: glycosyltransferase family 2 protein [Bacteroidales bacterium]|nr:glycosyltransferase family 2 protein [Bacteroidales bacterium]
MFSLIIPIYNAEATLARCAESIRRQSDKDWELILVNDGSTDESGMICQNLAATDARIHVLQQANAGPAAARNHGLEVAQGEWILFVDADDWVEEDYIKQYRAVATKPKVLPVGRTTEHDGNSLYLSQPMERFSSPWARCYNAHIIKEHLLRFPNELTCGEDAVFNLRYCQYVQSVVDVEYYGYHRIVYSHSLSHRNGPRVLWQSIEALEQCRNTMPYIAQSDFYNSFVQSRINIRCRDILNTLYPTAQRQQRIAWLRRLFANATMTTQRFTPQYKTEHQALTTLQRGHYAVADSWLQMGIWLRSKRHKSCTE